MIDREKLLSEDLLPDYDMIDTDEELSLYNPLRNALITCREIILGEYNLSDKKPCSIKNITVSLQSLLRYLALLPYCSLSCSFPDFSPLLGPCGLRCSLRSLLFLLL